jgi:hypothetical protein
MRGTHQILHFNFHNAFMLNPLVFISTPLIIYTIIYFTALLVFKKQLPKIPINSKTIAITSAIISIFWVARNL